MFRMLTILDCSSNVSLGNKASAVLFWSNPLMCCSSPEYSTPHSHQCRLERMRMGTKDWDTSEQGSLFLTAEEKGSQRSPCHLHGEEVPPYFCRVVEIRTLPTDSSTETLYCRLEVIVTVQLSDSVGRGHHLIVAEVRWRQISTNVLQHLHRHPLWWGRSQLFHGFASRIGRQKSWKSLPYWAILFLILWKRDSRILLDLFFICAN